jgi:hypothetical protein
MRPKTSAYQNVRFTEKLNNLKLKNKITFTVIIFLSVVLYRCGVYSFSGASISPDIETVSVDFFYNEAGDGPPYLSQQFTEGLKEYFQNNTNLGIDNSGNGDLQFSGNIASFRYNPIAPTVGLDENQPDNAGLQRLSISIRVEYINTQDDTFDFDQQFSFYADYDPRTTSISAIEPALVEEIFTQLYVDIFNASVANW